MEKQFRITAKTNPYIAQRDAKIFKGNTRVVLQENLSLEAAKAELERMADSDYEDEGGINWDNHSSDRMSYEWDSRYFSIEEMSVATFSIETYNSNAEIRIDSSDETVDWINITVDLDEIDRDETTEQNLRDIKNLDILEAVPSGHVINDKSLDQVMEILKIWIDAHCK